MLPNDLKNKKDAKRISVWVFAIVKPPLFRLIEQSEIILDRIKTFCHAELGSASHDRP